jgi:hypothetical protein
MVLRFGADPATALHGSSEGSFRVATLCRGAIPVHVSLSSAGITCRPEGMSHSGDCPMEHCKHIAAVASADG